MNGVELRKAVFYNVVPKIRKQKKKEIYLDEDVDFSLYDFCNQDLEDGFEYCYLKGKTLGFEEGRTVGRQEVEIEHSKNQKLIDAKNKEKITDAELLQKAVENVRKKEGWGNVDEKYHLHGYFGSELAKEYASLRERALWDKISKWIYYGHNNGIIVDRATLEELKKEFAK